MKKLILIFILLAVSTVDAVIEPVVKFLYKNLGGDRAKTMHQALKMLEERNMKIIVETGTARGGHMAFSGDGGFTIIFGLWASLNGGRLYSVDIREEAITNAKTMVQDYLDAIEFTQDDSVHYLRNFDKKIDLLYLDSLDYVKEDPLPSQIHHLNEIRAAYDKLKPESIVMIDDCDLPGGGKGKLVIEWLQERGWKLVANSYQVILIRS